MANLTWGAQVALLYLEEHLWHGLPFGIAKGNLRWLDVCCSSLAGLVTQLNARRLVLAKEKKGGFIHHNMGCLLVNYKKNTQPFTVFNSYIYFIHFNMNSVTTTVNQTLSMNKSIKVRKMISKQQGEKFYQEHLKKMLFGTATHLRVFFFLLIGLTSKCPCVATGKKFILHWYVILLLKSIFTNTKCHILFMIKILTYPTISS